MYERIRETMPEPATEERDKLIFTPKEVRIATGLSVGTVNNRAERLGIQRKGFYTLDEVERIIRYPLKRITACSPAQVELLRERLEERLGVKPADNDTWQHRWPWDIEKEKAG